MQNNPRRAGSVTLVDVVILVIVITATGLFWQIESTQQTRHDQVQRLSREFRTGMLTVINERVDELIRNNGEASDPADGPEDANLSVSSNLRILTPRLETSEGSLYPDTAIGGELAPVLARQVASSTVREIVRGIDPNWQTTLRDTGALDAQIELIDWTRNGAVVDAALVWLQHTSLVDRLYALYLNSFGARPLTGEMNLDGNRFENVRGLSFLDPQDTTQPPTLLMAGERSVGASAPHVAITGLGVMSSLELTNVSYTSDPALKRDIAVLDTGWSLKQLQRAQTWRWDWKQHQGEGAVGFLATEFSAQDAQVQSPGRPLSLDMTSVLAMLWDQNRQQQQTIERLQRELERRRAALSGAGS